MTADCNATGRRKMYTTLKGCSTVQNIVIEIWVEQIRLFQCNRFHYADFRDWNRDWFFRTSSARSEKKYETRMWANAHRWNLQGCPKLANRSQLLVCQSSPY